MMSEAPTAAGELEENKHHNVPSSRGGSDDEMNLSLVRKARHDTYHNTWAANRIPCVLTRFMALHSIGAEGRTLEPQCVDTLFRITTMTNWHKLYVHGAIAPVTTPSAWSKLEKVARYTVTHLTEERFLLRSTLHGLTNGGMLPSTNSLFLNAALKFFGVKKMEDAIHAMYHEENGGHLTWVRPMQRDTRRDIVRTIGNATAPLDDARIERLVPVLERQESFISRYIREWDALADAGGTGSFA